MEDAAFETAKAEATKLGTDHGKAVASWVFDGNTSAETYAKWREMLDEGDPDVYDAYRSPLSGEYADDMTPQRLLSDIGVTDADDWQEDALCRAYEEAHLEAWSLEVGRIVTYHTEA